MKMRIAALGLGLLGGVAGLVAPSSAQAGNVGYFKNEGACVGYVGDPAPAIMAAGHTPVAVASLDAASLAPLDGLVYDYFCAGAFVADADVNTAVANGMALFLNLHLNSGDTNAAAAFPGAPALTVGYACSPTTADTNLAIGSPIASGVAGTLTDASLDSTGLCSSSGYVTSGPLPGGFVPLLTSNGQVSAFSYTYGAGTVAVGLTQLMAALPGGIAPAFAPGVETFYSNTVEYIVGGGVPEVTCASEGYTGTKLEWCKNICERGYTGGTLAMWIRRWTDRYRTLPYCALAPEPTLR